MRHLAGHSMHAAAITAVNRDLQVPPNKTYTTVCMHISEQDCGMVMWLLLYISAVAPGKVDKASRIEMYWPWYRVKQLYLLPVARESFWQPTGGTAPPAALARPAQGSTHHQQQHLWLWWLAAGLVKFFLLCCYALSLLISRALSLLFIVITASTL